MLVDFSTARAWSDLNAELQSRLALDRRLMAVQAYRGLRHALAELALGLTKQFPQKTRVHYAKGLDPFVDQVGVMMAKAGLDVEALSPADVDRPEAWAQALDPRRDLFVLYPTDDPFLGRRHGLEALQEALKSRMVVSIRVSHHSRFPLGHPPDLGRFEVLVQAIATDKAVAFLGVRARPPVVTADQFAWTDFDPALVDRLRSTANENQARVETFEASGAAGSRALLDGRSQRLFDRAIVFWEDMDGAAVIRLVAEAYGWTLNEPGYEERIETLSLARWGGVRTFDFLVQQGFSPVQLRGTILIDQSLLNDTMAKTLDIVRTRILKLQKG